MKREWTHGKLTKLWPLLLTADRLLACTARPGSRPSAYARLSAASISHMALRASAGTSSSSGQSQSVMLWIPWSSSTLRRAAPLNSIEQLLDYCRAAIFRRWRRALVRSGSANDRAHRRAGRSSAAPGRKTRRASALERLEQHERSLRADQLQAGVHFLPRQPPTCRRDSSPSRVCALSRRRSAASSDSNPARSTAWVRRRAVCKRVASAHRRNSATT